MIIVGANNDPHDAGVAWNGSLLGSSPDFRHALAMHQVTRRATSGRSQDCFYLWAHRLIAADASI